MRGAELSRIYLWINLNRIKAEANKMKNGFFPLVVLGLFLLILFNCVYTLKEWEQGWLLQLGEYERG